MHLLLLLCLIITGVGGLRAPRRGIAEFRAGRARYWIPRKYLLGQAQ